MQEWGEWRCQWLGIIKFCARTGITIEGRQLQILKWKWKKEEIEKEEGWKIEERRTKEMGIAKLCRMD